MADALQKGIQVVQQAVQHDTANNYLEAIRLYRMALDHFQTALAVELDPSRKSLIQSKMSEYSDRMKKIQVALTSKQDHPQPQPQPQPQPTPTPVASTPTPSVPMSSLPQGPYGAIPTTGYGVPGGQLPTPAYGAGVPSSIPVNPSIPSTPLPTLASQSSLGQLPSSAFSGVSLPASAFPPSSSVPSLPTQSSLGQINPSYLAQSNPSSSAANPYAAFGSNPSAGGQANSGANPYANFSLPASGGSSAAANPYANLPTSNSSPSLSQLPGSLGGMSVGAANPSPIPGAVALPGMHQPTPTPTPSPAPAPTPSVGGGFSVSSAPGVINPAHLLSAGPPKPLHVALTTTALQHPRSQCSLKAAMYLAEVAQQEDQQRNYQDALDLYTEVLERFLLISENESNPMFKQTYREQMEVYMRRAEQIKTSLQITPNRVVESVLQQASRKPEPSAPLIDLAPSQPPPGRPLSAKPSMGPGPGTFAASSSSDHLLSNPPPSSRRNPLYDNVGPQDNMNFFGNHDEPFDPTPNVGRIIQIANETKSVLARQRLKLAICLQNNLLQPSENIKIHVKVENRSTMVVNFLKLTLRRIERTRKFDSKGREVMSVDAIKVHRQEFYQGSMFPLPAEANYTGELLYQVPAGLRPTNMFQRGIFEREYDMCIECDLSMRKNLKVRFEVIIDRPH